MTSAEPLSLRQPTSPALHLVGQDEAPETNALTAARTLFRATLDLLADSAEPARDLHRLAAPLSRVVAGQTTRRGLENCARLARVVGDGDVAAALDICQRLIEAELPGSHPN